MRIKKIPGTMGILFALGILFSCNDNNNRNEDSNEVVEVGTEIDREELSALETNNLMVTIEGDPDLGTFAMSLNGRDAMEYFRETQGPYTVFAPSNLAYSKMNREDRDEYLSTENSALVNYLVVKALMPPETLKEQIEKNNGEYSLTTMQGEDLTFTLKDNNIQVVGATGETAMVTGNKKAANGVVYLIDEVLLPLNPSVNSTVNE